MRRSKKRRKKYIPPSHTTFVLHLAELVVADVVAEPAGLLPEQAEQGGTRNEGQGAGLPGEPRREGHQGRLKKLPKKKQGKEGGLRIELLDYKR